MVDYHEPDERHDGSASDDDESVEINDLPFVGWTTLTERLASGIVAPPSAPMPLSGVADVASLGDPVAMLTTSLRLEREQHRSRLTDRLILLYFFGVAAVLLLVGLHRVTVDESLRVANAFLTPVIALLGAGVGHYFARKPGGA